MEEIQGALAQARLDPYAFFGVTDDVLTKWQRAAHPDRFVGTPCESQAAECFKEFRVLYDKTTAKETIDGYRVLEKLARGDLCDVFVVLDAQGNRRVLKKAFVNGAKGVLRKERKAVDALQNSTTIPQAVKLLFPTIVDGDDGMNLLVHSGTDVTLQRLLTEYPEGLDGRHIVWLFKRILLALTWVHDSGVIHGAITPEHILVCKQSHGIVMLDWIHSGKDGDKISVVPAKYKHMYDQVKDTKTLTPELDISMAAQSIKTLLHKDCPKRLAAFVNALCSIGNQGVDGRPKAWVFHQELTEIAAVTYGKPKFVKLV